MPLAAKPPAVAVSSPMRWNDQAAHLSREMHQCLFLPQIGMARRGGLVIAIHRAIVSTCRVIQPMGALGLLADSPDG